MGGQHFTRCRVNRFRALGWGTVGRHWDSTWTAPQVAKFVWWNFLRQTSMAARRPTELGLELCSLTIVRLHKKGEYPT